MLTAPIARLNQIDFFVPSAAALSLSSSSSWSQQRRHQFAIAPFDSFVRSVSFRFVLPCLNSTSLFLSLALHN